MFDWAEVTGQVRKDFNGMNYEEREALKREAWELYRSSTDVAVKVSAVEMIIRAHYDRSRASYKGRHPDFYIFACHWVAATGPGWFGDNNQDVHDSLVKKYPAPKKQRIKMGRSYWGTL